MSPAEKERVRGEVTFVDRWVGHLLRPVDAIELWRDTVLVVLCDHGTEVGDHGRFGKGPGHMHPYNTRINLMVRHPGGPRGLRPFVQTHDLLPTVLRLLDLPTAPCDGEGMWRFVEERGRLDGSTRHGLGGLQRRGNWRAGLGPH